MQMIRPWAAEYDEYRRDESRSSGEASSISFPTSEAELRTVLAELDPAEPVTVQAAARAWRAGRSRTGVMSSALFA